MGTMRDPHRILMTHFEAPADADSHDLIWEHGDPIQALLLFPLFFPSFVEVDGHVVLESYVEEEGGPARLRELLRSSARGSSQVLEGYRWREVPSQFRNLAHIDEDTLLALAQLIAVSWKAALSMRFPDRAWSTAVLSPQQTGGELAVSFTQAV
jgi:hypothetical protein